MDIITEKFFYKYENFINKLKEDQFPGYHKDGSEESRLKQKELLKFLKEDEPIFEFEEADVWSFN